MVKLLAGLLFVVSLIDLAVAIYVMTHHNAAIPLQPSIIVVNFILIVVVVIFVIWGDDKT